MSLPTTEPTKKTFSTIPYVTVTLSTDKKSFGKDEPVFIDFCIKNEGNKPVKILNWVLPNDGIDESNFTYPALSVSQDGKTVPYTGKLIKYSDATDRNYRVLNPGSRLNRRVNVCNTHDCSRNGRYKIAYKVSSFLLTTPLGTNEAETLTSQDIDLDIKGHPNPSHCNAIQPTSCNASQKAVVDQAVALAVKASAESRDFTAGIQAANYPDNMPCFEEWLGDSNAESRVNTIFDNFDTINRQLCTDTIHFDCSCKNNYYAFVYPSEPFYIYLCSLFWQAPLEGTDSQMGTIIHEMVRVNRGHLFECLSCLFSC